MQINSEKFNGVLSVEQSLSNKPKQINTYNCIIDTIKDSDEVLFKENTQRSNQIRIRNNEHLNQNCANVFHAAESNGSN